MAVWAITIVGVLAGALTALDLLGHSQPPTFNIVTCPAIFAVWPILSTWLDSSEEVLWAALIVGNAIVYGSFANWVTRLVGRKISK